MLLLRHEEIAGLLTTDETIAAVRAALVEQGEGAVDLPPRLTVDSSAGRGWLRLMPTLLNRSGYMGYKAMHSTPGVGVRYLVALYAMASGELLALVDADWITAARTAAVAAVATDVLARPRIQQAGILGSSHQARALLTALSRVRALPSVRVYSPTAANRERFAAELSRQLALPVTAVASLDALLADCDLLGCAIRPGATPVLRGDALALGVHVNALSSIRPESRELDDSVWRRASCVVVDDRAHAFESGDGQSALRSSSARQDDVAELWEVIAGRRPGRRSPDDVTLFKAVGTGLLDLALAIAIYERARERGLGADVGGFPRLRPF
ncbi:MAG TPA: ornithine cyclodeaminase family protein [Chloroflexota bacterium]|nr:ornithine cyclodeaminase family protein [Chloroflexota bacterium]